MKLDTAIAKRGVDALLHAGITTPSSAVIVALPLAMDSIRLVGDEEKHATLLYFGETSSLPDGAKSTLTETLQQVSQMVEPFGERVISIERLGDDDPPALVSKLSSNYLKNIRDILQVNPTVKGYLSNAQQHPEYTPHVTLAYPDYKGETDIRKLAVNLRRVGFDRLALWWNAERIEFPLTYRLDDYPRDNAEAGWSQDLVEKYLEHHGVKGMKWGVRKAEQRQRVADNVSEDARKTAELRYKAKDLSVSSLSNDEISTACKRIELEQKYARLTYEPTKLQKGYTFVKKLLGVAETANKAVTLTKSPAGQAVKNQIQKQRQAKTA